MTTYDLNTRLARFWQAVPTNRVAVCVYGSVALHLLRYGLSLVPEGAPFGLAAVAAVSQKIVTIFIIVMPFQLLFPGVRRKPKISTYEFWLDILYWHQGLVLSLLGFWVMVGAVRDFVWGWTSGPWLPGAADLPFWLQVLLAMVAYDFLVYWRHRAEHAFRVLWSFHAVHHSTTTVDVLTTLRVHPFELLSGAVCNAAVALIGFDAMALGVGFALYLYWNYFIHTNVRLRFPGPLKYVLVSPFMHQWHHAIDDTAMGKNVGVVFAWNDWLFGTAYHPKHWPTQFGFTAPENERVPQSYIRQMLYPLQYGWAQIRNSRVPR